MEKSGFVQIFVLKRADFSFALGAFNGRGYKRTWPIDDLLVANWRQVTFNHINVCFAFFP